MKKLFALALPALLLIGQPAGAWPAHGVGTGGGGGGTSPNISPGGSQPSVNTSTRLVTATYNTITPTSHGSSGDYGYAIRGGLRWNSIPYREIGSVGVSVTEHIGFVPWHVPTTTDMVAGLTSNISSATVRCDGGSWFTISGPSANSDASGLSDWNFQVTSANFADGLHKCDVVAAPSTGPDVIADGPVSDPYGSGLENFKVSQAIISDGTGLVAGNTLTVLQAFNGTATDYTILNWRGSNNSSNAVGVGQSVSMMGASPNTFVSALGTGTGRQGTYTVTGAAALGVGAKFTGSVSGTTLTVTAMTSGALQGNNFVFGTGVTPAAIVGNIDFNSGACTPSCTGRAGVGTYALSTGSTAGSQTMTASAPAIMANARSFYFLTNYNGTLSRPTTYVSLSGSDSNGGTTSAAPFLTIGKAIRYIQLNGTASGIYGGTVCLMGGSTYSYSNYLGGPWGTNGWLVFQSANQAPCSAAGDPGGATVNNSPTVTNRQFYAGHTMWRYMNFNGIADNGNGGDGQYLAVDHVTQTHDLQDNGGLLGSGGAYCVDSTVYFGLDGLCSGSMLNRGNVAKYFTADAQHDVSMSFGNTFDAGGNVFKWVTGNTTAGSNVITNVTLTPAELSGYTLSSIFGGYANINVSQAGTNETECMTGTWPIRVTAVNDGAKTITVLDANNNPPTVTNCTAGNLDSPGAHSDEFQVAVSNPQSDLFVANNTWGPVLPGLQQGEFLETPQMSGVYVVNNTWNSDSITDSNIVNVKGGNENVINGKNTYTSTKGKAWNVQQPSIGDTLEQDVCPTGGWSFGVAGTNQRSRAAASTACYTSVP